MMCQHTYRKEESTDCAYKTWGVLLVPGLVVSVLCAPCFNGGRHTMVMHSC